MSSVFDAPWFYWAIGVAVGFPVCLVFLTEVHNALLRRGNVLAGPVHLLRNYILPLGALLILLVQAIQVSGEATPVRVVATVFGFVVLVLLLSGLNVTMFQGAPEGSWRKRIPSIFLDVARFALIAVGVGVMLAYIWGANVGGLFTALGVSSIVLGLTLQNSVGQIISGLLVLFEQPFQLGDWIETPTARGRVVEVNWRATHIDTGSGHDDHAQLGAGRRVVHQLQPAAGYPLARGHHRVLGRRSARRRHRDAEPGGRHAAAASTGCDAVQRPLWSPAVQHGDAAADSRPTTSPRNRSSCAGFGMHRGARACISTKRRTSSRHRNGCRRRCGSSRRPCG